MGIRIRRKDRELNDVIEVLDARYVEAQSMEKNDADALSRAWSSMSGDEIEFIDRELERCVTDRRYYLENYHVITDEHGRQQTLYPFWDHQEIIYETLVRKWAEDGCFRGIILKPRQCGGTVWSAGIIFHSTVFVPNAFNMMMSCDAEAVAEIDRRISNAYNNLPFWMRPEVASRQQERHWQFERTDMSKRAVNPGMGSTLLISNAQKMAGVAIGRTLRGIHMSEVSRYPDASVYTSDIKPSMNARDILAIMESTAFGRNGLFYNQWKAAESGKSAWTPIFIPVYRVRKYSIPLTVGEVFKLTADETALRENVRAKSGFVISKSFFKWRRNDIIETENSTGSDQDHYEAYPVTPGEAFINSGFCAFPKKCLNEQGQKHVRDPQFIGEIEFVNMDSPPILHLRPPKPADLLEKPERVNRLWVWEPPSDDPDVEYYIGADASSGDASDYSDACVFRAGNFSPDVQVAEWHGLIAPSHYGRVLAALGQWYNLAEIANEYQMSGITSGNVLLHDLDYPNIYRWTRDDKLGSGATSYVHWLTNSTTRPAMIDNAVGAMLDRTVELRSHHLLEEMRDFGRMDIGGKQEGIDNNDDAVMAMMISLAGLRKSIRMSGGAAPSAKSVDVTKSPQVFGIYDHLSRQIAQAPTEKEAHDLIAKAEAKHKIKTGWRVVPLMVMKANTIYSPIFDGVGAENELYNRFGMRDRDIRPDTVYAYRQAMNAAVRGDGDE